MFNTLRYNVEKWPNILLKSYAYGANTTRFLKYVWSSFNIMHEMIKLCSHLRQKKWLYALAHEHDYTSEKVYSNQYLHFLHSYLCLILHRTRSFQHNAKMEKPF